MNKTILNGKGVLALLVAGMFLSAPAFAKKPEWAGQDGEKREHHKKHGEKHDDGDHRSGDYERDDDREHGGTSVHVDVHFGDHDRVVIHDYYEERYSKGRCPPGLAKKNNGCMPPGQAKKWTRGRPLPRGVIYHDLPPRVVVELGTPPHGHKYVRVAADILLIAVGTGMVVDAIEDLGRM
jgi:Ni/Co efflux regulator RcnB